ncbi:MAG: YqgE/AlgH family protein [Leptospiraceae bacterium]|nr:YqgE/AlgH family protein [Leptospiraceae bacterium]
MSNSSDFQKGKILISNSTIVSDEFNKSVVLMVEHDPAGAFGLVFNKPSKYMLSDVVVGVPEDVSENVRMFWGGPVDHSFISILHNYNNVPDPGLEVIPGVFLSRSFDLLIRILKEDTGRFKVFHGYSGWGAGQLENEFQRKSWVDHIGSNELVFENDPEEIWRDALKSKGGIYKYFAEHTKDPLLN